jgi:hypothetical protein
MNHIIGWQMRGACIQPRAIDYDAYRARAAAERQRARTAAFKSVARHFHRAGLISIQTALAAAVLACTILFAFGPADAAPNTTATCEKKYQGCLSRCRAKYDLDKLGGKVWADKVASCSTRTCLKQNLNCMASVPPGKLENPPPAHKPRPEQASGPYISDPKPVPNPLTSTTNNSAPLGTGILDGGNGMGGNGPSATGSPAGGGMPKAPPAAPPVILR